MTKDGTYVVTIWPVTCPSEAEVEGAYPRKNWDSEEALQEHLEKKYGAPNYTPGHFEFEINFLS